MKSARLGCVVGAVGLLAALALPFAPVDAESSVVSWPTATGPARPTTAFLVPYRPAELRADVPCAAVRAALAVPTRTIVLATTTDATATATEGLVLDTAGGRARIAGDGSVRELPVPTGDCRFEITADSGGLRIDVAGRRLISIPEARAPQVFAFDTDLDESAAAGLSVTVRTPRWFESSPTALKKALIALQLLTAAAALVLLAGPVRRVRLRPPRLGKARLAVDAAVCAVLAGWAVIGPLTDDDGFATAISRNAGSGGDAGNYYRWFDASEAPFALGQTISRLLVDVTLQPVWLRLPAVLAAMIAWLVTSRVILPRALGPVRPAPAAVAGLCFLAWWLPYDLGARPEPLVAMGTVVVLALLLVATADDAPRPLPALGAAVLASALTVAVAPSGLLVVVPYLLCAPRLWTLLRGRALPVLLLLAAVGGVGLTVMFADQTWHGVAVATDIHRTIGPDHAWFEEYLRYSDLLGEDSWATPGKRLPVLLVLALTPVLLVLLARHGRSLAPRRELLVLLGAGPLALLTLTATPSKWTHHFGAVAGLGVPFLVAALVVVQRAAAEHRSDRTTLTAGMAGGALVALAAALAFSGPNTWWAYSDFGMAGRNGPIPVLSSPLLWVGGAAVVLAVRRRQVAAGLPAGLAVVAAATSVTLLLTTFIAAPLRRHDTYSLAAQNIHGIAGAGCGIEDHVEVLQDVPGGALRPVAGADQLGGFRPDGVAAWTSLVDGALGSGRLTTRWFALPRLGKDQALIVPLTGRLGDGTSATVEFGQSVPGGAVRPSGTAALRDPKAEPGYAKDDADRREQNAVSYRMNSRERQVPVPPDVDRVRLVATDGSTLPDGWISLAAPKIQSVTGLREFLDALGPVLVDWPLAFLFPCRDDMPTVAGGLAQAPRAIVAAPKRPPGRPALLWGSGPAGITYAPEQGGSFAGVYRVGRVRAVTTRLVGDEGQDWGEILLVEYPLVRDGYDVRTEHDTIAGWDGDPGYDFDRGRP